MNRVRVPVQVVEAMASHRDNTAPDECCGLIATDPIGEIRFVYPLTNADRSATSFTIEPDESYGAFIHADRSGWRIGGVFHSHPSGPEELSGRDVEEWADPSWLHFLLTGSGMRCYRLRPDGTTAEVVVDVV